VKKFLGILAVAVLVVAACDVKSNSEIADQNRVQDQQAHYATVQPIPYFDFSMDRDTLVQIYKAKNEARTTHSVVTSQGTGAVLWDCPSIGFPLPADTQLTNGLQPFGGNATGLTSIEQAEPNGLYSSKNTDATYVLCIGDDGKVSPVYTEQKVNAFPFPVTISADGTIKRAGSSSIAIDVKSGVEGTAPEPTKAP